MDSSKDVKAFQLVDDIDETLLSPVSMDTISSSGSTFSNLSTADSSTVEPTTTTFVVTEELSKVYYKGLPSKPLLIATTNPVPYKFPSGPEAFSVLKELRVLGNHPLASFWDNGLADGLRSGLNRMHVDWTSIEALRIVEVGEYSGPAIVWIGVNFGALSFFQAGKLCCPSMLCIHQQMGRGYPQLPCRNQGVLRYKTGREQVP